MKRRNTVEALLRVLGRTASTRASSSNRVGDGVQRGLGGGGGGRQQQRGNRKREEGTMSCNKIHGRSLNFQAISCVWCNICCMPERVCFISCVDSKRRLFYCSSAADLTGLFFWMLRKCDFPPLKSKASPPPRPPFAPRGYKGLRRSLPDRSCFYALKARD